MILRESIAGTRQVRVTFVLQAVPHPDTVVVGDFNHWNHHSHPLIEQANGTYRVTLVVEKNRRYAFRYRSGDFWFNDGHADAYEPNAYGSDNGILLT